MILGSWNAEHPLCQRKYEIPNYETEYQVPTQDLESCPGVYKGAGFPLKITMPEKEGSLYAQAMGQPAFLLRAFGKHQFRFSPVNLTMVFLPGEDKTVFTHVGTSFELAKE